MLGKGAGVGVRMVDKDGNEFAQLAIPTKTTDAQRTECLGPVLACLFIQSLAFSKVDFYGDSKYVVGLLNREFVPVDYFLSSCVELVSDILASRIHYKATWIPREENSACDSLARKAVNTKCISVECSAGFQSYVSEWKHVA